MEAGRPDTIDREKLHALRAGGATRISINPQSMDERVLKAARRPHSAQDVLRAFDEARAEGFDCINMDVIAGLEGDTPAAFRHTMEMLTARAPENLTVHTLAIKRAADWSDRAANAKRRDEIAAMLESAAALLTKAEYAPYYLYRQKFTAGGFENVGWCQPGCESLYNVCMMEELQTVVSLGAGAVSKQVDGMGGRIVRYANPKYPTEYLTAGERIAQARRKLLL